MITTILLIFTLLTPPKIVINQLWVRTIPHKGSVFVDTVQISSIDKKYIFYRFKTNNREGKTFKTFFLKNFKPVK